MAKSNGNWRRRYAPAGKRCKIMRDLEAVHQTETYELLFAKEN